ncbi:PTS ascorbate transporter subunit IIC [Pseudoclavibacter chungangensis]|uniref:Ascorbate-specific PTS system EIIC component n=1 Tax=Pseudoclavibacter chungangensis TaxID=587635 RepID=A0A7J5BQS3_9MICO|nr:PTS ascorbate transporter subunit IIC [Pseudoclavibacter chungangensis]KAB1656290.1 PTS ascorbate transporter subunit IIC [Pseudoclavibacter chungangensis]NYJ67050.1 PTS system ascorbate-specific IIC component [Pseudoclavibacter chungangensis]
MEWLVTLLDFIGQQILNVPAYLVGIIVAIGLIALRKSTGQVVGGALKATLGFLILGAGAGVVTTALDPLGALVLAVTGAEGVIPTNEVITAMAADSFGSTSAYILSLGFVLMLVIARFTPLHYVFLTGHHMVFMAMMLSVLLSIGFGTGNEWLTVLVGAFLLAVMMVAMPAFAQPWTKRVTGNDTIAIGHFGTLGYIAAGATGQAVGRRSVSTEEIKVPQGLRFLRDSMVATALSMVLIYLVFAVWGLVALGDEALPFLEADDSGAFVMAAIMQGLMFGVGVSVILYGVRTFLGELIPAFQGIAKKVVPGAKAALDIPIVFPFAQNAVLVGFLASFLGGLVMLFLLAVWLGPAFGLALILPGMVPHFFTGGGAGVYGNATGGRRGASLGGFVNGLLITLLPAFLYGVMSGIGLQGSTFGDADFGWFGSLVGLSVQTGSLGVGIVLTLLLGLVVLGLAIAWQVRVVDRGWMPGAAHQAFIDERTEAEKAAAKAAKDAATARRREASSDEPAD